MTAPASLPRRSWTSLPPRARPSTRLSPRSTSSDYKVAKKPTTSKNQTRLSLSLPLLAMVARKRLLRPPPPPPPSNRHPHSHNPGTRTIVKVHVACRSSALSHRATFIINFYDNSHFTILKVVPIDCCVWNECYSMMFMPFSSFESYTRYFTTGRNQLLPFALVSAVDC